MDAAKRTIETTLPGRPEAATRARRVVRSLEGVVPPERLDDVELLASELVGNSVRHALCDDPNGEIDLKIMASPETVRLEVVDSGPGFEPRAGRPSDLSPNGRGLFLVETLSERWGVKRNHATTVWCELDVVAAGG